MKWLAKLLYASAGPTRSTLGESEESWKFVRPMATWVFWVVLFLAFFLFVKWIGPWIDTLTDRQLLWLILFACLWRR